ncbi:MAG: VCBS repeat-containing protein [Planctomycetes bacterium]|nr:VCBS repeat-containing protein [Planctomycetota bacterium]
MGKQSGSSRRTWWLLAMLGVLAVSFPWGYSWLRRAKENLKADRDVMEDVLAAPPSDGITNAGNVVALEAENVLAADKQKHIWDAEHATFALETYFGTAFQEAIRNRDRAALERFFAAGAEIAMLPRSDGQVRQAGPVREAQVDAERTATERSDVTGFVESFLHSVAAIEVIEQTGLRVLELDTTDGMTWASRILISCRGRTADEEQQIVESYHSLKLAFTEVEEVESEEPIILGWRDESRSSRVSEQVLMSEVTEATGLGELPLLDNWQLEPGHTSQYWFQVAVADFNKDEFPDIAVAPFYGSPLLLRSDQCQQFVDVTMEMKIKRWKVDGNHLLNLATWIDFDNDSWPDLLLGDRLYRNVQGQSFEDVTQTSGLRFGHHAMGAVVADYDCDGLPDLYILYQHDPDRPAPAGPSPWVGDVQSGVENRLWRNEGGGHFRDVTEETNASGGARHSFAASWHFLDDDHYPDLYIANDFGQNVHLLNRGDGTFEDVSEQTATSDFATSMGACTGDLNNDGKPEIYIANMYSKMGRRIIRHVGDKDYTAGIFEQIRGSCAGNRLYTSRSGADRFDEVSELAGVNQVGWAYAPTMADFNSDGLLDIYATTGFMSFDRRKPDG